MITQTEQTNLMNEKCKQYAENFKKKTRGNVTFEEAILQLEGAANYTYARFYHNIVTYVSHSEKIVLPLETDGTIEEVDLANVYDDYIRDLTSYYKNLPVESGFTYKLEVVDVIDKSENGKIGEIEIQAYFVKQVNPGGATLPSEISFAIGDDWKNYDNKKCDGTNPLNLPFQASGSGSAVHIYDGINTQNQLYWSGYVYATNVQQYFIESIANYPNNIAFTNPYGGYWRWSDGGVNQPCMSYNELNSYLGAMPYIHEKQKIDYNIPSNLDFIGINTLPTWGQTGTTLGNTWTVEKSKYAELITIATPVQSGLFSTQ